MTIRRCSPSHAGWLSICSLPLLGLIALTACAPAQAAGDGERAAAPRFITVPANTVIDVRLENAVGSELNRVEDPVRASLTAPVFVDDEKVIPIASLLLGEVTHVKESAKVKGRAELTIRFNRLKIGSETYDIRTEPLRWVAKGTKKDDATKIGIGAAAGALVGAIAGGGKGAAIGTAVGAGGGTAVVLATEGEEISLGTGHRLHVELTEPVEVRRR